MTGKHIKRSKIIFLKILKSAKSFKLFAENAKWSLTNLTRLSSNFFMLVTDHEWLGMPWQLNPKVFELGLAKLFLLK